MLIVDILIDIFRNFHIQLLIAELMFCIMIKPRIKVYFIILLIGVYCIIPYVIPGGYFWSGFTIGSWFTFGFIFMLILSIGIIWVSFKITSFKELLFYGIAAMVVQHIVYSIARAISLIFDINSRFNNNLVIVAVFFVAYSLFYIIFVRRLLKENIAGMRSSYLIVFALLSIFFIHIISVWTTREEIVTIGSFLFDTFSCILILAFHFGMFERSKLERQNETMHHILELEKHKHEMSAESIELINLKYHDIKYQIDALKNLNNAHEQEKNIEELEKTIKIYDMTTKTGNETLDIVLSEKSLIFEKNNINFACIADGSKLNFIAPSDIYSLFGNALDNAIESVRKIDNEDKRVISLNIASKGNCVVVNISNYYSHELIFEDGFPKTTKTKSDFHGFGIKSIKYITEKYGGTMIISPQNDIFKLNILIPIRDNT